MKQFKSSDTTPSHQGYIKGHVVQEEIRALRGDNATLAGEVEQMNRVASYVGSRVAKVSQALLP